MSKFYQLRPSVSACGEQVATAKTRAGTWGAPTAPHAETDVSSPLQQLFPSKAGGLEAPTSHVGAGAGGQSPLGSARSFILNKKPTNRRTPRETSTPEDRAVLGRAVIDKLQRLDKLCPDLNLRKEARAIENCGTKAAAFECMGQRELWEGESINRRHRLERRVRCKRDFAPCCSEYDCNAHKERANRIIKNVWETRLAKWVITFGDADCQLFRDHESLGDAMRAIASVVEEVTGADGAIVSLHVMGDKSDRYRPHFEVLIPHDGRKYPKAELNRVTFALRHEIAIRLDLQELANAHFGTIFTSLTPVEQKKKWFHQIRYAVHPVVGAERFVRLPDEEAAFIVMLLRGLRRVRGFGCFGDRRIKKSAEALRKLYPIDLLDEPEPKPEVHDGGPCPDCSAVLKIVADMQHALVAGGREIAPDLFLFEFIDQIDLSTLRKGPHEETGDTLDGSPDDGSSEAA